MRESYEIKELNVDGGKAKIVWLRLPEKILVILLTFPTFFKGFNNSRIWLLHYSRHARCRIRAKNWLVSTYHGSIGCSCV